MGMNEKHETEPDHGLDEARPFEFSREVAGPSCRTAARGSEQGHAESRTKAALDRTLPSLFALPNTPTHLVVAAVLNSEEASLVIAALELRTILGFWGHFSSSSRIIEQLLDSANLRHE